MYRPVVESLRREETYQQSKRMSGEKFPRVSSSESMAFADASAANKRRKRKWDQPAESLVATGVAVPGILPSRNMGSLAAITLPGVTKASGALLTSPLLSSSAAALPLIQQYATIVLQNINQKKLQDELMIAREIIINDADSAVRYMLTKRQTQEEIQKCTGSIVITRGKYHPTNAPSDGEKPLYLHISAGAHLETTVERIKAVDHAAAMVEELLKQGSVNNGGKAINLLSTCVYLGFETDPSLNVAARIRGPNDQYVNHIMNETGATVLLRGRGSGNSESRFGEEGQQPLHLFLSSNNPISLESAKLLADNLLDTISIEFGASRKVYGTVPPPQQLKGFQGSVNDMKANNSSAVGLISSTAISAAIPPGSSATHPGINTAVLQGAMSVSMGLNSGHLQPNTVSYPQPSLAAGTSYSGYGGIYPQATPLQQVALVPRQSPSIVNPIVAPASTSSNSSETLTSENRASQKRKFQESPAALKGHANPHQNHGLFSQNSLQGSEFVKPGGVRNLSTMPAPKKLARSSFDKMPPPPPRTMPLPPPPKFTSPAPAPETNVLNKSIPESSIPDTLIKLVEYGEEDDDPDEISEESYKSNSNVSSFTSKPFWAV